MDYAQIRQSMHASQDTVMYLLHHQIRQSMDVSQDRVIHLLHHLVAKCVTHLNILTVNNNSLASRMCKYVQTILYSGQGRSPVYIAADLSKVDLATALQNTSFDPSKPALFTIEGHSMR
jgi:hypothetical protein